jgi:hypothetical protein
LCPKISTSDQRHAQNTQQHNDFAERTEIGKIFFHVCPDETCEKKKQWDEKKKKIIT